MNTKRILTIFILFALLIATTSVAFASTDADDSDFDDSDIDLDDDSDDYDDWDDDSDDWDDDSDDYDDWDDDSDDWDDDSDDWDDDSDDYDDWDDDSDDWDDDFDDWDDDSDDYDDWDDDFDDWDDDSDDYDDWDDDFDDWDDDSYGYDVKFNYDSKYNFTQFVDEEGHYMGEPVYALDYGWVMKNGTIVKLPLAYKTMAMTTSMGYATPSASNESTNDTSSNCTVSNEDSTEESQTADGNETEEVMESFAICLGMFYDQATEEQTSSIYHDEEPVFKGSDSYVELNSYGYDDQNTSAKINADEPIDIQTNEDVNILGLLLAILLSVLMMI